MLRRHRRRNRLAHHIANPCHAVVEQLEGRRLLTGTTFNWVGGPGSWNNPASWSHDPPQGEPDRNLPNGEDTVNIGPEAGLVTIPAAIFAAAKILNLAANAPMETGANLNIFAKNGGNLNINGEDTTLTMVGGGNTRIIFNNNTSPNQVQVTYNIGGNGELRFESGGGLILTNGFGAVNDRLIIGASTTIRSTASSSSTVSAPVIINFGTMLSNAPGGTGLNISGNTTGGFCTSSRIADWSARQMAARCRSARPSRKSGSTPAASRSTAATFATRRHVPSVRSGRNHAHRSARSTS